jgi:hypothetical protein
MDLSTATDMTVQVPGLPLSISRSFSSTILGRNLFGPFGYGWVLGVPGEILVAVFAKLRLYEFCPC